MLRRPSLLRLFAVDKKIDVGIMLEHERRNNPYWSQAFPELARFLPSEGVKLPPRNWMESMLERYTPPRYEEPANTSDHLKHFVEGYRSPRGPIKWMSEEDKAKVHALIDLKMSQLEETGLSREEILYNRPGGIPLAYDHVFQLLKSSREVREMVVKEGQEFTVESVIDPALNQDFGIDRAKTLPNKDEKYMHELPLSYENSIQSKMRADDRVKSEDFYWRANFMGKLRALKLYSDASTVLFPKPLIAKRKLNVMYRRTVNAKDINFRNPALLSKFMAVTGKIRNNFVTKLDKVTQRKIARAIKHAKNLNIFPFVNFIQPFHKKTLSGPHFISNQLFIHCDTGILFANNKIEALNENNRMEESTFMRLLVEKYKKNLSEEDMVSKTAEFLNSAELDLLEALNYPTQDPSKATPDGKFTYDSIKKLVNSAILHPDDIGEWLIQERASSTELVISTQYTDKTERVQAGDVQRLLDELNDEKEKYGLRKCPESAIKRPKAREIKADGQLMMVDEKRVFSEEELKECEMILREKTGRTSVKR